MKEYLRTLADKYGNQEKFVIHANNSKLAVEEAKKQFAVGESELRELVKLEDLDA